VKKPPIANLFSGFRSRHLRSWQALLLAPLSLVVIAVTLINARWASDSFTIAQTSAFETSAFENSRLVVNVVPPQPSPQDNETVRDDQTAGIPPALTRYKGRTIAQTMHYLGAPWLIREEREREERCSLMLSNSKIKPGMTVCDIGCGNGFYTFRLAEMVGPKGRVYAVDIQPEMLTMLRDEMEKRGVENIIPVLGSVHNPRLPVGQLDAMLLADVYHEFSHPEQMLKSIRESLKPTGMAILLEFRSEDLEVPIKPLHKMSKKQIMKEWPSNGFKLVDQFDRLSWQHMMFFSPAEVEQESNDETKIQE